MFVLIHHSRQGRQGCPYLQQSLQHLPALQLRPAVQHNHVEAAPSCGSRQQHLQHHLQEQNSQRSTLSTVPLDNQRIHERGGWIGWMHFCADEQVQGLLTSVTDTP